MVQAEISKPTLEQTLAQSQDFLTAFQWVLEHIRDKEDLATFSDDEARKKELLSQIERKRTHTWDVIQAMWDILHQEGYSRNLIPYLILALTHDVQRFTQIFLGGYDDNATGYDHANEGEKLFKNSGLEICTPNIRALIASGIRQHSKKVPEETNDYVNLIRDADKLALIRELENDLKEEIIKSGVFPIGTLTPGAIEEFKAHQIISHKNVAPGNWPDRVLRFLSWIYDLNIIGTKRILLKEGLTNTLLELLKQMITPDQHQEYLEIEAHVHAWANRDRV